MEKMENYNCWNVALKVLAEPGKYGLTDNDKMEMEMLAGQYHYGIEAKKALYHKLQRLGIEI